MPDVVSSFKEAAVFILLSDNQEHGLTLEQLCEEIDWTNDESVEYALYQLMDDGYVCQLADGHYAPTPDCAKIIK